MIYEDPFEGREEVVAYLRKVRGIVPSDLKFVIDDITDGDSSSVGITWHVECGDGTVFPFSRGCSFYNLNQKGEGAPSIWNCATSVLLLRGPLACLL